jgi:hypothetical protein
MGAAPSKSKENHQNCDGWLFSSDANCGTQAACLRKELHMRWDELMTRSGGACEFCGAANGLAAVEVTPADSVLLCDVCLGNNDAPVGHWYCLEGAAWSDVPSVQIAVWHKLGALDDGWATDAREMMYVDPDAMARLLEATQPAIVHHDSNGCVGQGFASEGRRFHGQAGNRGAQYLTRAG